MKHISVSSNRRFALRFFRRFPRPQELGGQTLYD
jgi:hypothetical protein